MRLVNHANSKILQHGIEMPTKDCSFPTNVSIRAVHYPTWHCSWLSQSPSQRPRGKLSPPLSPMMTKGKLEGGTLVGEFDGSWVGEEKKRLVGFEVGDEVGLGVDEDRFGS